MQVIRLEHPSTGRGPYTWLHDHGVSLLDVSMPEMSCGNGFQPCFTRDGEHPPHWKYGFVSVKQAECWWDEEARRSARANGFKLAVYDVPDTAVDQDMYQCVFDPEVSKLVAHIPVEEWIDGKLNMLLQVYREDS